MPHGLEPKSGNEVASMGPIQTIRIFFRMPRVYKIIKKVQFLDRMTYFQRRTQNHPSAFGFVSKWVYNFWPAKTLCTYQDIFHSFKHHIGGGQQQKTWAKYNIWVCTLDCGVLKLMNHRIYSLYNVF